MMVGGTADESLEVVFGKAFLVELERGNLDNATLFARAFLLGKGSIQDRRSLNLNLASRFDARSRRPRSR
jgi:hypothetical protein